MAEINNSKLKASYAIYGASGFGREVMPLAREQLNQDSTTKHSELIFIDDQALEAVINGCRVLTYAEWINQKGVLKYINIAIANSDIREKIVKKCIRDGVNFFEIRSKNVVELDGVTIDEGAVLCSFVTLTSNLKIGKHFHANIYSYVAHDCVIGDFVTFAPGVHCNGNIIIEDHAYIGTGAILKQGQPGKPLIIGKGAVVGMGAVVTKNVEPGETVIGNPAKKFVKE